MMCKHPWKMKHGAWWLGVEESRHRVVHMGHVTVDENFSCLPHTPFVPMVHPAKDLDWIVRKIRKTPNVYSVEGAMLIVQRGKKAKEQFQMGAEGETLMRLVKQYHELEEVRRSREMDDYESGLYSYVTRMLGVLVPLFQARKWGNIGKTLADYKAREANGFRHDDAGRAAWRNAFKQGVEACWTEIANEM